MVSVDGHERTYGRRVDASSTQLLQHQTAHHHTAANKRVVSRPRLQLCHRRVWPRPYWAGLSLIPTDDGAKLALSLAAGGLALLRAGWRLGRDSAHTASSTASAGADGAQARVDRRLGPSDVLWQLPWCTRWCAWVVPRPSVSRERAVRVPAHRDPSGLMHHPKPTQHVGGCNRHSLQGTLMARSPGSIKSTRGCDFVHLHRPSATGAVHRQRSSQVLGCGLQECRQRRTLRLLCRRRRRRLGDGHHTTKRKPLRREALHFCSSHRCISSRRL